MTNETQNNGGQAFPGGTAFSAPGMTLRDWFAGMAMPGLLASHTGGTTRGFADLAYEIADAMLAERGEA